MALVYPGYDPLDHARSRLQGPCSDEAPRPCVDRLGRPRTGLRKE